LYYSPRASVSVDIPNDLATTVNLFFTNSVDNDGVYEVSFIGKGCDNVARTHAAIIEAYYNSDIQNAQVSFLSACSKIVCKYFNMISIITQTVAKAMGQVIGIHNDYIGDSATHAPRSGCTDIYSIMDINQVLPNSYVIMLAIYKKCNSLNKVNQSFSINISNVSQHLSAWLQPLVRLQCERLLRFL
jgi:hypothetical protein